MTARDPALSAQKIAETREDDATLQAAPWSGSSAPSNTGAVLVWGSDGIPVALISIVWGRSPEVNVARAAALARARNNLRALADQLEAAEHEVERLSSVAEVNRHREIVALREVERLNTLLSTPPVLLSPSPIEVVEELAAERDALRAEVRALREAAVMRQKQREDSSIELEDEPQPATRNLAPTGNRVEELQAERDALRAQLREVTRQRDCHRDVLNRFADRLRVVHEDPKISDAVNEALNERTALRAEVELVRRERVAMDKVAKTAGEIRDMHLAVDSRLRPPERAMFDLLSEAVDDYRATLAEKK